MSSAIVSGASEEKGRAAAEARHAMTRANETPDAVKDVALRLPPSEVVKRLLTDDRMQSVWRFLLRQNADQESVNRHILFNDVGLPPTWDADKAFSPQERAAAAFFASIVDDLTRKPDLIKRADAKARAKPFLDAAKLCREMIEHAGGYERGFDEMGEPLDFNLKKALGVVANILEHEGKRASAINDPLSIKRSAKDRADDELRVKTRKVAATMMSIYGSRNYEITARVVSIALDVEVSKKDIENWCADIPAYLQKESQ